MTAAELADALDRRADTFDACARPGNGWGEDRDLLRSASRALRRLGSASEGLVADCESVLSARTTMGVRLQHELDGVPTSALRHIRRTLRAALRAE